MTWKSVLGLRRVKLDCEKQCFFYWWIFAKFRFEKYDFTLYKGFFMEKKIQIRQILKNIFLKIARFLWQVPAGSQ